jgi:asparagine synthase (glutamine-hydrolysing)
MCGFAGFWTPQNSLPETELATIAERMAGELAHRGPDDQGVWVDPRAGIALAHRRLAVIDLSAEGHQPMVSRCGRVRLIYNGEIYNHRELRGDLEAAGRAFRGHSDTELLVEAIAHWGIDETLPKLIGMFAFAMWQPQDQRLTLVRDRLGIKPLYFGRCGTTLLFGSELKALRAFPQFDAVIDRNAIARYVQHNYIPAPNSIYEGVHKLMPGSLIKFSSDAWTTATPYAYWTAAEVCGRDRRDTFRGDRQDALEQLDLLLHDATRIRMQADVPWGAFLSGGIDSTLVTAAMQAQSSRPVSTFCIGFEEKSHDESRFARAVAAHLGTEHHEWCVTAAESRDVIPRLPTIYDEPFADSSQIPTFLVSQLARRHVTVSLSGDGGDELFGGYPRYFTIDAIWRKISGLPLSVRKMIAHVLPYLPANRCRVWAGILKSDRPQALYAHLNRHWDRPLRLIKGAETATSVFAETDAESIADDFFEQMMYLDTVSYLPDDILTKVDRASMAVSLEVRVPLLDHRLVEFAWSLPLAENIRAGSGKAMLRDLLERYVPRNLFERPKVGFGVPIGDWLRGPLRAWAEELLDERRLDREGYFYAAPIRQRWREHLSGASDWHYWLWDILMFQAWLEDHVG